MTVGLVGVAALGERARYLVDEARAVTLERHRMDTNGGLAIKRALAMEARGGRAEHRTGEPVIDELEEL